MKVTLRKLYANPVMTVANVVDDPEYSAAHARK